MLKDLLKEGGLYTLANLVTKGISLLLIPFYSDYFTTSEYGILALLGIAAAVTSAIFSFQIYQGVGRFISEKENTLKQQQRIGSTGLFFTIISYAVFTVIAFLLKDQIIDYISEEDRISDNTFYWWLGTLGLSGIFYTLGVQLRFLRMTKQFTLTSFLHAILNIVLILYFALVCDFRIDSIYMATVFITPLIILLQLFYLRKYVIVYLGLDQLKRLFKFSAPLIPAAVGYLILNLTDRVFIKDLNNSLGDVGIYDMGFKFSAIISLIILAFQSALAPIIYERHQDASTNQELGRIFILFMGVGTLGIVALGAFSYETLYIFTQPQYYEASELMPLFYLSVFITGLGMFSPGIYVKQKTYITAIVVLCSGLINVALNLVLIPEFHLIGAAIATLISTFINNITLFIISHKLYPLKYNARLLLLVIPVFVAVFLAGSYMDLFFQPETYLMQLGTKVILIAAYLFFLIQIKFISFGPVLRRLNRK